MLINLPDRSLIFYNNLKTQKIAIVTRPDPVQFLVVFLGRSFQLDLEYRREIWEPRIQGTQILLIFCHRKKEFFEFSTPL